MIEVLFGESEAASMKAAKNREVICLGFMLDIGLCHKASGACGKKRSVISYRNWGEVSTEEFAGFLSQERRLTKEEKIENEIKQINEQNLFLEHDPEADRPMLAYLKGDKLSLAVDAGYSAAHVQDFMRQSNQSILENLILL